MCLIIHKPKADQVIPKNYVRNAMRINQDGFGIVFLDTNECIKTFDYDYAEELLEQPRPFVAHFRYATQGKINEANSHPAFFNKGLSYLFSNGTVTGLGTKEVSDTRVVATFLDKTPSKYWRYLLSMTDTRFAVVNQRGKVQRYGVWHKKKGVFYSKDNCFSCRAVSYKGWSYYGANDGDAYEDYYFTPLKDRPARPAFGTPAYGDTGYYDETQKWHEYYDSKEEADLALGKSDKPAFVYQPASELTAKEIYRGIQQLEAREDTVAGEVLEDEIALDEYYAELAHRQQLADNGAVIDHEGRPHFDLDTDNESDLGGPLGITMEDYNYLTSSEYLDGFVEEDDGHTPSYALALPDPPANGDYVAVYGTLKLGHGNNRLLSGGDASFVGGGHTKEKLRMVDYGIPYVYQGAREWGYNIVVEVFQVNDQPTWESLDSLEGVPTHYNRHKTQVLLSSGEEVTAWMYYAVGPAPTTKQTKWIAEYK